MATEYPNDPAEIAAFLIAEEGLDRALDVAYDGIERANEQQEYYLLSIWREVRGLLQKKIEERDLVESHQPAPSSGHPT